jgi:AAA domain
MTGDPDFRVQDRTWPHGSYWTGKPNGADVSPVGFTALELQGMRFPPIKYVVTGYIVEGLTLLAGRPKRGKSWLLLHAAIAVRGGYTLGDVKCVEGDVFYAALEDNRRRLQNRMQKLLPAFAQEWPERLHFITEMPRLKDGGIEIVRRWIEQAKEPRLVIIDTLQKVRDPKGTDQNSYEADYTAVSALKALADEYGVAIVLVHHQRKMDADDPVDTVSGTTGLTGAVDTVLVLNNTGQGVTLYGRGRDIEEIEKAVTFDIKACLWRVEGEASEVYRSSERQAIVTALCDSPEPLSPREIADAAELPYVNVRQLLGKMHKAGEVEKAKRGLYRLSKTPHHNGHKITTAYGDGM